MKNKRIIITIIIFFISIIMVLSTIDRIAYHNMLYPKAKITGDGDIKIACVGDSITYGYGLSNRNDTWVSLLVNELGNKYQTINYGLISRTLLSSGNDPYMGEDLAKEFWNNRENIIIFMLGTNDSKNINWDYDKFNKEYREILDRMIKEKSNSKIYIMIPPQVFIDNPIMTEPNKYNLENGVVPIIREIKENYKDIELIDLYSLTLNHKEWFNDGIHPNKNGNIEIANEISRVIKETYNEENIKRVSK